MALFKTRQEEKRDKIKIVAIGAAVSAAAGYLAGVLTAPKSGKETRKIIADKTNDGLAGAEKQLKKLHTELTDVMDEASDRITSFKNRKDVDDALSRGKDAKQKAREMLSLLHDGEANDKELKKAVSDATKAIEHLRDFLRK